MAMVLAGIFATIVFQLLRGQSRFVALQSAREEVQQNVRGALDVVSAELRGVPPGALVQGDANRIRFLLPRVWGISCGGGTATALSILVPQLPAGVLTLGTAPAAMGVMGVDAASAWVDGRGGVRSSLTTVAAGNLGVAPCSTMSAGGPVQPLTLSGTSLPDIPRGSPVFLFQTVQYDIGSGSEGMLWVRRGNGTESSQQPLAGPLPDANSLRFAYYDTPGGAASAAPGGTAASLAAVDRVQVFLTTRSRSAASGAVQTQRDSVMVYLRNQ